MYLSMHVSSSIFYKKHQEISLCGPTGLEKLMHGRIAYLDAVSRNGVKFKCIPTSFPSCEESDMSKYLFFL